MKILMLLISILIVIIIYYLIQIGNKHVDSGKKINFSKKKVLPLLIGIFIIYFFLYYDNKV